MPFKTILAPIVTSDTTPFVIKSALQLAEQFEGHVHALHIREENVYYPPFLDYPVDLEKQEAACRKFAATLKAMVMEICAISETPLIGFEDRVINPSASLSFNERRGMVSTDYGLAARATDLSIVCLTGSEGSTLESIVFENLLLSSGHPVLLVPRDGLKAFPKRVLIAWDGSQPAARAVSAAFPMLEAAEDVIVMTIGEQDRGTPNADETVRSLLKNGIPAISYEPVERRNSVSKRLLMEAETLDCDLIVMGGYSHPRLFEMLAGGITRKLIENSSKAILMAH